jgi:capsular polysaccharide biosynthesis protein
VELLEKLRLLGFQCIDLEGLGLLEQAEIFSRADCVIAPHGAGLTNILFCRPGTIVVDIFAPTYVNACYWVMANELGLAYSYLLGEGPRPPRGIDPDRKIDDIRLNIPSLLELLHQNGVKS